jgi:hypothetical protein
MSSFELDTCRTRFVLTGDSTRFIGCTLDEMREEHIRTARGNRETARDLQQFEVYLNALQRENNEQALESRRAALAAAKTDRVIVKGSREANRLESREERRHQAWLPADIGAENVAAAAPAGRHAATRAPGPDEESGAAASEPGRGIEDKPSDLTSDDTSVRRRRRLDLTVVRDALAVRTAARLDRAPQAPRKDRRDV